MASRKNIAGTGNTRKRSGDVASSSKGPSNFDNFRFISVKNEKWYLDRVNNTVLVEINIDPDFDNQYYFHENFDQFGWGKMLDLPIHNYANLVRQSYANIDKKSKFNTNIIETYVKGVHMRITRDLLANILWASDNDPLFEHGKTNVIYNPNWIFKSSFHKFCYSRQSIPRMEPDGGVMYDRSYLHASSLSLRHSLLVY